MTHNCITESESVAQTLARAYEENGLAEAPAWEAALADLAAGFGKNEKAGVFTVQMAEPRFRE